MTKNPLLHLVIAFLACFTSSALASPPLPGTYTFNFTGLWDVSGNYAGPFSDATGSIADLNFNCVANQAATGKLTGTGAFTYPGQALSSGTFTLGGSVRTIRGQPIVMLTVAANGAGSITLHGLTQPTTGSAQARINFSLDPIHIQLVSIGGALNYALKDTVTGKRVSGASRFPKGVRLPMPGNITGASGLTLDFVQSGPTYTGTATIQTSIGASTQLAGAGTYSSKRDTSTFLLKSASGHLTMTAATSGTNMTLKSLKGSLFGQTLNYKAQ